MIDNKQVYEEFDLEPLVEDYKFSTNNFMEGSRTWVGLGLLFLGMFGLGDLVSSDQAAHLLNAAADIVGLLIAIYGNYKAHKQIKKLGGY